MSVFNISEKIIYIHIPKTGGTSIEKVPWLEGGFNQHGDIGYYINHKFYTEDPTINMEECFKFTFVRNPYDRFMSGVVNHIYKGQLENIGSKEARDRVSKFIIDNADKFNDHEVLKEQHLYITVNGEIAVGFIGKMENMQEDFNTVCNLLDKDFFKIPHENKGQRVDYSQLYTEETKKIVGDYYSKDFEMFGYEKA